jgi:hypothetical protein
VSVVAPVQSAGDVASIGGGSVAVWRDASLSQALPALAGWGQQLRARFPRTLLREQSLCHLTTSVRFGSAPRVARPNRFAAVAAAGSGGHRTSIASSQTVVREGSRTLSAEASTLRVWKWGDDSSSVGHVDVTHRAYRAPQRYHCGRVGGSVTSDWCVGLRNGFPKNGDHLTAGWLAEERSAGPGTPARIKRTASATRS